MVHTSLGLLSTTNVYSALATIAKAEMIKQVAIAIHALKIMKKREHLEKAQKPSEMRVMAFTVVCTSR